MANKSVKTPMAVDKSNTPAWMRVVIIVVAVSFVASGIAIVAAGIGGGGTGSNTGASGSASTDENQARVDNAMAAADSSPDNPEVVIQVGHAYFEWAVAVYESGQQAAAIPLWKSAVSYYDKVLAIDPSHDIALGNKAFALYYAQDAELAPAALRAFIENAADNTSLTQQVENARGMLTELESVPATTTP